MNVRLTDDRRDAWLESSDQQLLKDCSVDTYRASGPGGQKRNKTDSAVRLRHHPTGLVVVAVESRSQHENRAKAVQRLRRAIALHVRRETGQDLTGPGIMVAECIGPTGRLIVGARDARRNRVIADVVDVFEACEARVSAAAEKLGISTANLVAFFRTDDKLWARANELRGAWGLKPIR